MHATGFDYRAFMRSIGGDSTPSAP